MKKKRFFPRIAIGILILETHSTYFIFLFISIIKSRFLHFKLIFLLFNYIKLSKILKKLIYVITLVRACKFN